MFQSLRIARSQLILELVIRPVIAIQRSAMLVYRIVEPHGCIHIHSAVEKVLETASSLSAKFYRCITKIK